MESILPNNEHPDNQLFRNFCAGQSSVVDKVYKKGFNMIRQMVEKNAGNTEDAEDLFQEGLLVLIGYCYREEFRLSTPLVGFLYGICRNLWLKKLKNKSKSGITFHDIEAYVKMNTVIKLQDEEALRVQNERILWKHLSRLPEKEQKVLRLYYLEGKSHREIAREMGFADETSARVQKFRYLNHLRSLIWQDPDFN